MRRRWSSAWSRITPEELARSRICTRLCHYSSISTWRRTETIWKRRSSRSVTKPTRSSLTTVSCIKRNHNFERLFLTHLIQLLCRGHRWQILYRAVGRSQYFAAWPRDTERWVLPTVWGIQIALVGDQRQRSIKEKNWFSWTTEEQNKWAASKKVGVVANGQTSFQIRHEKRVVSAPRWHCKRETQSNPQLSDENARSPQWVFYAYSTIDNTLRKISCTEQTIDQRAAGPRHVFLWYGRRSSVTRTRDNRSNIALEALRFEWACRRRWDFRIVR